MAKLNAKWLNFSLRGQTWDHFWMDAKAAASGQVVAIGQATETDSAMAVAWAPKNRLVNQAVETDTAQAVGKTKVKAIGQASETDLAQAVTHGKVKAIGQSLESDAAQAVGKAKAKAVGQAEEVDSGQSLVVSKSKSIGQANETDSAFDVSLPGGPIVVAVGQADETDEALTITPVSVTPETGGSGYPAPQIFYPRPKKKVEESDEAIVMALISLLDEAW